MKLLGWKSLAVSGVLALSSCLATGADDPPPLETPFRVLLLGDSISIGYTSHVETTLEGQAIVHRPRNKKGNPANCQGTNHGVEKLDEWLAIDGGEWDVIHFNFGLHDLKRVHPETGKNSNNRDDPHQAAPSRYEAQLREIVERLEATGARLIFATTTPVPPGGVRPYREPEDSILYNAVARKVMAERRIPVNDLYGFVMARVDEMQRPADVHFSKEGSAALGDEVVRWIRQVAGVEAH